MRIGIDARFFGPESKGLGRYTQKLLEELEKIDHENDYVVFLMKSNFDQYTPQNPRFKRVVANYRWYSFAEQVFLPFVMYREKCDFIHFPHFNVPLFYWGKFVVTIHDLILLRFPTRRASTRNFVFYQIKFFLYKIVIAHAIHRSQKIAAVSQFTKKDILSQYDIDENKIVVTYESGFPSCRGLRWTDQHEGDQVLVTGDTRSIIKGKYLLYVGNAYPHKNLSVLVDAFAGYRQKCSDQELSLVFVGREDYFYKQLRAYVEDRGIEGIVILDTVDNALLEDLYINCLAFVFPSLYEGFGLPPLEACLLGVPVLSSELSCMPEILGDAVYYADVESVYGLQCGIEKIVQDRDLRRDLSRRGPEQARNFSWEKTARETHDIYLCIK